MFLVFSVKKLIYYFWYSMLQENGFVPLKYRTVYLSNVYVSSRYRLARVGEVYCVFLHRAAQPLALHVIVRISHLYLYTTPPFFII
jgi:hypothetical protein